MAFEAIGWRIIQTEEKDITKRLKEAKDYEIAELRTNEKIYSVKDFPALSGGELSLAESVFSLFIEDSKTKKSSSITWLVKAFCEKKMLELDEEQEAYISFCLESVISGFGVLNNFLENENIEEIAIIGAGKDKPVYVYEKNFGWLKSNVFFQKNSTIENLANKMSMKIGRHLSLQTPQINAFLPDGSRLNACIPPVSLEPTITIRKFAKNQFTPLDLIRNKTISASALAFLWMCLQTDSSIIISGNTGSGKTTTLNALFSFVPKNERIIVVEETPEIVLPQNHVAKLTTVETLGVSMDELVTNTLRMRPDRVIVGEIRNAKEVSAFINTILAGQGKGSVATFHAKSAQETVLRLKKLGAQETDIPSIDLIIVQKRWNVINTEKKTCIETRKITEVAEISCNENGALPNVIFEFNYAKNRLEEKNNSTSMVEKISRSFGLSEKKVFSEIKRRTHFLEKLQNNDMRIEEFVEVVQNEFG